jgi:hypothetical protein
MIQMLRGARDPHLPGGLLLAPKPFPYQVNPGQPWPLDIYHSRVFKILTSKFNGMYISAWGAGHQETDNQDHHQDSHECRCFEGSAYKL